MSNPRNPARDKPGNAKAANGKSQNGKKTNGKKELKRKTVAAEIGATVMREETAAQMPSSAEREIGPAAAKPAVSRPARPAPKPATAKPAPVVAKPAPQPARPAPVASKPPMPKPATAKPAKSPQQLLESAVDTIERSFKAAGEGTVAVNCKLLDFARINVNSNLDYVKDLAAARSPVRIMRLQIEYWHDCLETFASQAQELRALQAELVANANESMRRHMRGTQRAA